MSRRSQSHESPLPSPLVCHTASAGPSEQQSIVARTGKDVKVAVSITIPAMAPSPRHYTSVKRQGPRQSGRIRYKRSPERMVRGVGVGETAVVSSCSPGRKQNITGRSSCTCQPAIGPSCFDRIRCEIAFRRRDVWDRGRGSSRQGCNAGGEPSRTTGELPTRLQSSGWRERGNQRMGTTRRP